jgi:hypothetical protein
MHSGFTALTNGPWMLLILGDILVAPNMVFGTAVECVVTAHQTITGVFGTILLSLRKANLQIHRLTYIWTKHSYEYKLYEHINEICKHVHRCTLVSAPEEPVWQNAYDDICGELY